MVKSIAEEIKFVDFCKLLEDISAATKQGVKQKKLEEFYSYYKKTGEEIKKNDPSANTSFFPMLRLLLPQLERERPAYGLNRFSLRRIISKILALPKDSDGFKRLGSDTCDFADTAYNLLMKQFNKGKNLSISQINNHLDVIAKRPDNQASQKETLFLKLFQQTSPVEQKWLLRIILKKLGLGLSETKILNTYHLDASILLNNTNNLLTVCDTLSDPSIRINNSEIVLFTPIRPMLSKRCDAKEMFKSITDNKVFIIETKFDGERFQLHMENNRFKFFSRGGFDFSKKFGEDYNTGIYTPLLKGVFNNNVKSILLDGEMMGWNRNTKEFGSKGMHFDVKNLSNTSLHQPCFCVFDILLYNGEVLAEKSLKDRLKILKDVFTPREGIILHSIINEGYTKQDVITALNNSMDKKEEGIVYKDPNSHYIPNDRNGGWWKMKLEYFSGVMTDLDVIIMGGFYGKAKKIDGFIVGVSISQDYTRKVYLSLAKITSGLSSAEWDEIRKYLEPNWIKTIGENYETYGLNFGKMKPDVWVSPKKSCILLVRATELTKVARTNSDFKTPYTLRFPRIETIRFDKPCDDCLTFSELEELVTSSSPIHKLYNKHLRLEDIEYEMRKTKKFKPRFIDTNVHVEEKVSDILKNREFYVLSGSPEWKIDEVEKLIKENGGNIVKAEGDNTYCILAGEKHIRLEYYKGSIDIVKLSWLRKVLDQRKMYPYHPEDTIYVSEKTKERFLKAYDKYGDSYTDKASKFSLEYVFSKISEKDDYVCPLPMEIDELHTKMKFGKRLRIFNDYIVYFDKYEIVNNSSSELIYNSALDEIVLKFWGGRISTALTLDVNLIIIQSNDDTRKNKILTHDACGDLVTVVDKSFLYQKIEDYKNNV